MKVTILGTGTSQGIPIVGCKCEVCLSSDPHDKRLRCSIVVSDDDTTILVDTGPDLRQQLLTNHIDYVDAILYTHEHNDHVIGLDDIRPIFFKHKGNIPSYALERVNKELRVRFAYMFTDYTYPGVAKLDVHHIDKDTALFHIGNIPIQPIGILHGNLDILAYRFGDVAYITDASKISAKEIEKLSNIEVVIVNALRYQSHPSHFNLDEALSLIETIGAKKAYITHLSHEIGIHDDLNKKLPKHIQAAYDGLVINI